VGIGPDVIFDGLKIQVAARSLVGYRVDIPRLVRRTSPCGNDPRVVFDGLKAWDPGIVFDGPKTRSLT